MEYPEFHYVNIFNILSVLGHILFAFIIVFFVFPRFLFSKNGESFLDKSVANYVSMIFLVILLGYFLVVFKIFELVAIVMILVLLSFRTYFAGKSVKNFEGLVDQIHILAFDYFDGIFHPIRKVREFLEKQTNILKGIIKKYFGSLNAFGTSITLLIILFYSIIIRFYDSLKHAAPALSDAYITLSWIKYIERRMLFEGGIYPRGFHITLATLQKFAAVDTFYILRFAGPLNGVLITIMLYFTVSRLTGRKIPGLIAAFIFGVLGQYLPTEWQRQASTNSQEFAMIFVLPALYFYYLYLKNGSKSDLYIATSGVFITALVHMLPFALTGMGMGVLVFVALIVNFRGYWKRIFIISLTGVFAVVLAASQLLLGGLMGYKTHSSSSDYLTNPINNPVLPQLRMLDYFALNGLILVLIYTVFLLFKKKNFLLELFVLGFGTGAFLLYYIGGILTKLEMISSRSRDLWSLVIPLCIGMGWYALTNTFLIFIRNKVFETVVCLIVITGMIFYLKPSAIEPYKMEFDANVEQYLRISDLFKYDPWILVSNPEEELAIVYGSGKHARTLDFVKEHDSEEKDLSRWTKDIAHNIFIYNEKVLYHADVETDIVYNRKESAKEKLTPWLEKYKKTHDNWSIFYEDENLQVIYIKILETNEERLNKVWEK